MLEGLGAVVAQPRLFFSEKTGTRSFFLWGKLAMAMGRPGSAARKPVMVVYVLFLFSLIVTVMPISLALQAAIRPFRQSALTKMKARFEHPSGSATDRCHLYDD